MGAELPGRVGRLGEGLGVLRGRDPRSPDTGPARSGCLLSFPGVKSKWHLWSKRDSRRRGSSAAWRLGQHCTGHPLPYSPWTVCFASRASVASCAVGHC